MSDFESKLDPLTAQAHDDWTRARRKVLYQRVVCAVTQCSVDMLSFAQISKRLHLSARHARGLQEIPLDQIRGSVGRYEDFTSAFLPRKDHLRDRWTKVEQLLLQGKAPPIDVYKVGQAYFVVDGNHRVSAARQLDLQTIEAHVTEFDTPLEAELEDIDRLLIDSERLDFLEQAGQANSRAAADIEFSCVACYRDLSGQIDAYRRGMEAKQGRSVPAEEAFAAWHQEVYLAAIGAIRKERLLELFPDRTEADLFIWSWRNSQELETEVLSEDLSSNRSPTNSQ